MMLRTRFLTPLLQGLALTLPLALGACSGGDGPLSGVTELFTSNKEEEIKQAAPAATLYNEGLALMEKKNWKEAAKKFSEVDKNYPYSELAKKSILLSAYSFHEAEDYDSAATTAERYISLHPGSEDVAYAKYLLADSNFKLIPDVARDQGRSEKALAEFKDIMQRHPQSPYARASEERVEMSRDQLAGKEMEVGRFYMKQKSYLAAVNRFRSVVEQYQNTRHVEEALFRLVEAYMALGVVNEAQTAAAVLGHNFPESQWYRDAYSRLQTASASNGAPLEPQESGDSWISRAFKRVTG